MAGTRDLVHRMYSFTLSFRFLAIWSSAMNQSFYLLTEDNR